jgi:hypothetical protein
LKRPTGWLKLRFLTELGRFHWNQVEKVAHFAWFGEPWSNPTHHRQSICILLRSLCSTFVLWKVREHAVVGKETLKFGSISFYLKFNLSKTIYFLKRIWFLYVLSKYQGMFIYRSCIRSILEGFPRIILQMHYRPAYKSLWQ